MPQRRNYWSCTAFARWVMRTFAKGVAPKPESATSKGWKEWKTSRPARPDPYDISGWNDYYEKRHKDNDSEWLFGDQSEEERAESRVIYDKIYAIEKHYDEEDEAMMIKLIKLRQSLWT